MWGYLSRRRISFMSFNTQKIRQRKRKMNLKLKYKKRVEQKNYDANSTITMQLERAMGAHTGRNGKRSARSTLGHTGRSQASAAGQVATRHPSRTGRCARLPAEALTWLGLWRAGRRSKRCHPAGARTWVQISEKIKMKVENTATIPKCNMLAF